MPASKQLNTWIAESASWQSFRDFSLPEDAIADYPFIRRYDDFYLSLMSRGIELLKNKAYLNGSDELLPIAKGLEIFSLVGKREYFEGVNRSNNILYAASLYFLSGYPASSWILSKIYPLDFYKDEIDEFIFAFLKRDLTSKKSFVGLLNEFLSSGDYRILDTLLTQIRKGKDVAFKEDYERYFSFLLAESLIEKFEKNNLWYNLLGYNNDNTWWRGYVLHNINKKVPIWSFFPSQMLAVQGGLLDNKTCSLQMPTSSGKTSMSELIIYNEFQKDSTCKILYLAPYRALAAELKLTLAKNLAQLGIKSKTIYGGNIPTTEELTSINEVNLLISTPEKFMAIEDIFPGISMIFSTVICDEGHLLDDESRGLSYELLLSRFKIASENKKRFIFISAIIPNISVVNSWLGGDEKSLISSDYRPTELEFAFLMKMDRSWGYYLNVNPHLKQPQNYKLYKYLTSNELEIITDKNKRKKITTKKGISVACALKACNSGNVALFAPHKRGNTGVEDLAEETINQLGNNGNISLKHYSTDEYLNSLQEYFSIVFGEGYLLTRSASMGFLFHHGDFPQNIREIVEDSLRNELIRFVICTNTLAEGVNLPIKNIVIHSTKRYNPYVIGNFEKLKIRDLKNLVGRSGRAGRETKGMIIIPHSDDFERILDLINGNRVEPVKGQLYNIIKLITNYLTRHRLLISTKTLDALSDELQELLDSVDTSMIDLLSEEVSVDNLNNMVKELIDQTLSFYQADSNEKKTLGVLFDLRIEKLKPMIERNEFRFIKRSGANIRQYDEIINTFNFDDKIWNETSSVLNEKWLNYLFDDGIFKMNSFSTSLDSFNERNKCDINSQGVKKTIVMWMQGLWFYEISQEMGLEIYQVLRLINSFISFNIQSVISSIIRLKSLIDPEYSIPDNINNWPSFLLNGIDGQTKLDLIEMGLNDRISVIEIERYLKSINYIYTSYRALKNYLIGNKEILLKTFSNKLPQISFAKLDTFISRLNITGLL